MICWPTSLHKDFTGDYMFSNLSMKNLYAQLKVYNAIHYHCLIWKDHILKSKLYVAFFLHFSPGILRIILWLSIL